MWMKKNNTVFVSMHSVPFEMKDMMTQTVLPKIVRENKLPNIPQNSVNLWYRRKRAGRNYWIREDALAPKTLNWLICLNRV